MLWLRKVANCKISCLEVTGLNDIKLVSIIQMPTHSFLISCRFTTFQEVFSRFMFNGCQNSLVILAPSPDKYLLHS